MQASRNILIIAVCLVGCGFLSLAQAQTLYEADFTSEGDGFPDHTTTNPPATGPAFVNGGSATSPEGRWTASYQSAPSTDTTDNEFSVNSGVLRIQDWGANPGRWESFTIDVSSVYTVTITATGQTIGSGVQNASSEFFEYFYTLDGGADIVTGVPLTDDTAGTPVNYSVVNIDVSGASTLTVGFSFQVDGASDGYEISAYTVEVGTGVGAPSAPADLTANATAKDSIDLSWTENAAGDDVLVAYNTVNSFDDPSSGSSYSAGQTIGSNGTVLGVFSSASAVANNLTPNQVYYFKAWSVNSSNVYSPGITATATTNAFDLQQNSWLEWSEVDVDPSLQTIITDPAQGWNQQAATFTRGSGFVQATPSGDPSESWLVSPAFDLDSYVDETFEFTYSSRFTDSGLSPEVGLKVFYATNYSGNPATTSWTEFSAQNTEFVANASSSGTQTIDYNVSLDLSGINGASVVLAFQYSSSDDGSGTTRNWDLSDPLVSGNSPSTGTITLTPGTSNLDEGTTTTLQIDLSPAPSTGNSVTVFLSGSNNSDLVEQGQADLDVEVSVSDTGTASITIEALDNANPDGNRAVDVTANAVGYLAVSEVITIVDDEPAPTSADLVITEIMYNPQSPEGSSEWEWIEIYNITASPIDITGYFLDDESTSGSQLTTGNIGAGSVPANGSAILFNADQISAADFEAAWGGGATLIPVTSWSALNNGGDSIAIWDSFAKYDGDRITQFNVVDKVAYSDDGTTWPADNGTGSIYLTGTIDSLLNDNGSNWAISEGADVGSATPVNSIRQSLEAAGNTGSDFGSPTPDQPDIILSASPTSFPENAGNSASTLTVSVSEAPSSYPLTISLGTDGDGSEISVLNSVVISSGTSATIGINALLDNVFDGDQNVTITATAAGYDSDSTTVTVTDVDPFASPGTAFISQYYHSTGTGLSGFFDEVWIEICVPAGQTVDFTGYTLAVWSDSEREGWKNDTGTSATYDLSSLGSSVSGPATFLVSDASFTINNPAYALANKDIADDTLLVTGDDSIVLYAGNAVVDNLVDAISVTSSDTLINTSLVRTTTETGIDLSAGTSYLDYNGVWQTVSLATVNNAVNTDNEYLGSCDLSGANSGGGFTAFIDAQSGAGGTGPDDDKNGNGIDNKTEYTFGLQNDGTVANTAAGNANVPFEDLFGFSVVDQGQPTTPQTSDDRFSVSVELPASVPEDATIRVVASDIPNDDPDSPASLNTRVLAVFDGQTGSWMDSVTNPGTYAGTVQTNGGASQVFSNKTIGEADRDFFYYVISLE